MKKSLVKFLTFTVAALVCLTGMGHAGAIYLFNDHIEFSKSQPYTLTVDVEYYGPLGGDVVVSNTLDLGSGQSQVLYVPDAVDGGSAAISAPYGVTGVYVDSLYGKAYPAPNANYTSHWWALPVVVSDTQTAFHLTNSRCSTITADFDYQPYADVEPPTSVTLSVLGHETVAVPAPNGFWGSVAVDTSGADVAVVGEFSGTGYATVGAQPYGSQEVALPVLWNDPLTGFQSQVYVQNVGGYSTAVEITVYDANGTSYTPGSPVPLAGGEGAALDISSVPSGQPYSAIIVSNNSDVVATVHTVGQNGAAYAYNGTNTNMASSYIPLPFVAKSSANTSTVYAMGLEGSPGPGELMIYDPSGELLLSTSNTFTETVTTSIDLGLTEGLDSGFVGAAVMTADQPIAVVVVNEGPGNRVSAYENYQGGAVRKISTQRLILPVISSGAVEEKAYRYVKNNDDCFIQSLGNR